MDETGLKVSDSKFVRYLKSYLQLKGKHIGFYGNFGHGDLGDDAIFYAARGLFGSELLPISKRAYAFNPRVLKAMLVGCGGSLRWESPYLPRRLLKKASWPFPVVLFSAGLNRDFGKRISGETLEKIRKLCAGCRYLSARDPLTQRFLESLGFDDVHILPDLEILIEGKKRQLDFTKDGFTLGIVLSPHSEFSRAQTGTIIKSFIQFTDYLLDQGVNVVYLPFEHQSSSNKRELEMYRQIVKDLKHPGKVVFLENDLTPQEMRYCIETYCDALVCMRLHSSVFALSAGLPFLTISFNDMHRGFLELTGMEGYELELKSGLSFDGLKSGFNKLMADSQNIKAALKETKKRLTGMITSEVNTIKKIIDQP